MILSDDETICWEWNPPPDPQPSPLRAHEPKWSEPFIPHKGGARRRALQQRELARQEFENRWHAWKEDVLAQERGTQHLFDIAARWHPIGWSSAASRLDVYGGTAEGWASLLWTCAAPLIRRGTSVSIVDLTQQDIAELALWGSHSDLRTIEPASVSPNSFAPGGFDPLLGAASPEMVVSMLMRGNSPTDDVYRDLESDALRNLLEVLGTDPTLPRLLAAAMCVINPGEPRVGELLSHEEVATITDPSFVLYWGQDYERMLARIIAVLRPLTGLSARPAAETRELPFLDPGGTSLVSTQYVGEQDQRRRVDHMILASLIGRIEAREQWNGLLIVLGCDRLDGELLELLIKQAAHNRIQLLLFFDGLRGHARQILGRGSVDTILMSLGNEKDAEAAAGFVGREKRWKVSSLTVSEAEQNGSSRSAGENQSSTDSVSVQGLMGTQSRGNSRGWHFGITETWNSTKTYQETKTESKDFIAQPEDFQALPMTGLLFVRRLNGKTYVMSGDCHPAIARSPLVAQLPISRG